MCGGKHSKYTWVGVWRERKKKTMETLNISEPTNMPHPASENSSDRRAEAPLLRLACCSLSTPPGRRRIPDWISLCYQVTGLITVTCHGWNVFLRQETFWGCGRCEMTAETEANAKTRRSTAGRATHTRCLKPMGGIIVKCLRTEEEKKNLMSVKG